MNGLNSFWRGVETLLVIKLLILASGV